MKTQGILKLLPFPSNNKIDWPWGEETAPNFYDKNKIYPKLSIVTASYNQGQFIEETIRSVLLQNYPNLEFIIIDGGSTDNTIEIIKKYENWITYWASEKDFGIYDAMNKGLAISTGDWINFMNIQDYFLKDAFLCFSIHLDLSYKVVFSDAFIKDEKGGLRYFHHQKPIKHLFIISNMLHQAIFFNSIDAKKNPYNLNFKVMADLNLLIKLFFSNKKTFGKHINIPTVVYSLGGFSNQNYELMMKERFNLIRNLPPSYKYLNLLNFYRINLINYFK